MNPMFQGIQPIDAKDLVLFLIPHLHKELNKAPEIKEISSENRNLDQRNRQLVFKDFSQFFLTKISL